MAFHKPRVSPPCSTRSSSSAALNSARSQDAASLRLLRRGPPGPPENVCPARPFPAAGTYLVARCADLAVLGGQSRSPVRRERAGGNSEVGGRRARRARRPQLHPLQGRYSRRAGRERELSDRSDGRAQNLRGLREKAEARPGRARRARAAGRGCAQKVALGSREGQSLTPQSGQATARAGLRAHLEVTHCLLVLPARSRPLRAQARPARSASPASATRGSCFKTRRWRRLLEHVLPRETPVNT